MTADHTPEVKCECGQSRQAPIHVTESYGVGLLANAHPFKPAQPAVSPSALVCANRGQHPSDVTPEERADVCEVTYTLYGLPLTFALCADCRGWFEKFYRAERIESNRGK